MEKSVDAFRTISEVADELALPQHVLRFWETRFPQVKPLKRAGGRRYYRPADVVLLKTIRQLLYEEGFTIKGVQKLIKEQGTRAVREGSMPMPVDLAHVSLAHASFAQIDLAHGDVAQPDFAQPNFGRSGVEPPIGADEPITESEIAVAEHRIERAAEPVALPDSFRAALEGAAAIDPTRLSRRDLGTLRDALATIDECVRILGALRRPRG